MFLCLGSVQSTSTKYWKYCMVSVLCVFASLHKHRVWSLSMDSIKTRLLTWSCLHWIPGLSPRPASGSDVDQINRFRLTTRTERWRGRGQWTPVSNLPPPSIHPCLALWVWCVHSALWDTQTPREWTPDSCVLCGPGFWSPMQAAAGPEAPSIKENSRADHR